MELKNGVRRVDNQARGRSGRQGDEGSSIFYVSLEDDLMRIFGSESMNNILQNSGLRMEKVLIIHGLTKLLKEHKKKLKHETLILEKL